MRIRRAVTAVLGPIFLLVSLTALSGAEPKAIALPKPRTDGGRPLMDALRERKSVREIGTEPLPPQTLANLLWAAFGINRPDSGRRTAPSAMNCQEIDVYVATNEGLFLYDAATNRLQPVASRDIRAKTGGGAFAKDAPVSLIFVADHAKMKGKPADQDFYAAIDSGFISQNVYLFCASEGLATVVHDLDRAALAKEMPLRPEQRVVIAQAVGFPKK